MGKYGWRRQKNETKKEQPSFFYQEPDRGEEGRQDWQKQGEKIKWGKVRHGCQFLQAGVGCNHGNQAKGWCHHIQKGALCGGDIFGGWAKQFTAPHQAKHGGSYKLKYNLLSSNKSLGINLWHFSLRLGSKLWNTLIVCFSFNWPQFS